MGGMAKSLYLIDGHAQIYRAYHAMTGLTSRHGEPTNATFGFVTALFKLLQTRRPDYLGLAMDAGIEHLLSSKTEIKAATILFLPNILSYCKIRFDLIIQNTKQVDSPAEQFNLLSAFVAGVPAGTKE